MSILKPATIKASADLDAMWAEMDKIRSEVFGKILQSRPAGSVTVEEYMAKTGLSRTAASRELIKLTEAGKVKQVTALIPDTIGRNFRTRCYIPIKKK